MKAAVFHGPSDIRVEEVSHPGQIAAHEVRLRPLCCGICGTDLHEYADGPIVIPTSPHLLTGAKAPQIMGHEFSAEVLEVGAGVNNVSVGQRVSVMPLVSCGTCFQCVRGRNHLCKHMAAVGLSHPWGGIGEEAVIGARQVFVIPDEVSDVQGALVEPTAVAAYGVDSSGVKPGETLLITGAGPIGILAAIYGASQGLNVVISEVNPERLALARSLDAGEVLDARSATFEEELLSMTDGVGADGAVECSGSEPGLQGAMQSVRAAGTIVQTGLHTKPASIDAMRLANLDLTLKGTWCFPVTDWPRIIGLIARGKISPERVVSSVIDIDDVVTKGFDRLIDPNGNEVKVLVRANS